MTWNPFDWLIRRQRGRFLDTLGSERASVEAAQRRSGTTVAGRPAPKTAAHNYADGEMAVTNGQDEAQP